jgi:hypothetical protein
MEETGGRDEGGRKGFVRGKGYEEKGMREWDERGEE